MAGGEGCACAKETLMSLRECGESCRSQSGTCSDQLPHTKVHITYNMT
jgi:hypothetical protein